MLDSLKRQNNMVFEETNWLQELALPNTWSSAGSVTFSVLVSEYLINRTSL